MQNQNLFFNILAFNHPAAEYTFCFTNKEREGITSKSTLKQILQNEGN